jgi:uncharacterized protein YceK
MKAKNILILTACAFCCGCSTVNSHVITGGYSPYGVYSGVHMDVNELANTNSTYSKYASIDLPFSFVGDTLILPYDLLCLPSYFYYRNPRDPGPPSYPSFTNTVSISDEALSNALAYYILVDDGSPPRFTGRIRSEPSVVITNIVSFAVNLSTDYLIQPDQDGIYGNGSSVISITLSGEDAQRVDQLIQATQTKHDLLLMLDHKPLAQAHIGLLYSPSFQVSKSSRRKTIYLPLREDQNILEISNALRTLGGTCRNFPKGRVSVRQWQ